MGIDEELRRLDEQRGAGELSEVQYQQERARLLALTPQNEHSPPDEVPPEQRWLSQQPAAWPSQPQQPAAWYPQPQPPDVWTGAPQPAAQQPASPPQQAPYPPQWQQQPPPQQWQPPAALRPGVPPQQPAPPGWNAQPAPGPQAWQQPWQQQPPQPPPQMQPQLQQWQAPPQQWAPQPQHPQAPQWVAQQQQHPMMAMHPGAQQYAPPMPPTYMMQAVLATMFCCMPLGVMAIVKASQVSSAWSAGDFAAAQQRSDEARSWVNWSVVGSLAFGVAYFIAIVFVAIGGAI